jgi:hypothetical protein
VPSNKKESDESNNSGNKWDIHVAIWLPIFMLYLILYMTQR